MSAGFNIDSEGDIGVKVGEEAVDRPEKLNSGSSEIVWTANDDMSKVVAMICALRRVPNVTIDTRHSSLIGLGVMNPSKSS